MNWRIVLLAHLALKDARILNNRGRDRTYLQQDVGRLAAKYIMENLKKDMVIGTAWGTTLRDTLHALYPADIPVDVVQLMGSVPCKTPNCTPQAIVAGIADRFNSHADFLNMPLFIEDDYVRQQLCEDSNNKKILNKGILSDMILSSISDVERIGEKEFWLGYMTPQMYDELLEKGAVGAIFAHFFDKNGQEIDCTWNRKCVSISFQHIHEVPNVVGIASSPLKAPAILAAIRGKLIDTLITDGTTATAILNML